jgi:hypothetical protein
MFRQVIAIFRGFRGRLRLGESWGVVRVYNFIFIIMFYKQRWSRL